MRGIILAPFTAFVRNPWIFALFTGMSILFAFMVGSFGGGFEKITIPVSGKENLKTSAIGKSLEENEIYDFKWQERGELEEVVRQGKAEAGVIIKDTGYEIIVGIDSPNVNLMEQTISDIYIKLAEEEKLLELFESDLEEEKEVFHTAYHEALSNPIFEIKNESYQNEGTFLFDRSLHSIFGFTLFFVIYTIAYNVQPILIEKRDGIWDRMILSPLKKWEMYVGNLLYSFFEGFLQILIIFSVFHFIVGIDFNGKLPGILLIMLAYTFTIVALSIFVTSLVKNTQQFNAVLPILSVSMAMIGGGFWPIEIVQSEILLTLSKINPLTYGMEALNGLVLYNQPVQELLMPVSILILMGVVFIGIGIHLMERRHV